MAKCGVGSGSGSSTQSLRGSSQAGAVQRELDSEDRRVQTPTLAPGPPASIRKSRGSAESGKPGAHAARVH